MFSGTGGRFSVLVEKIIFLMDKVCKPIKPADKAVFIGPHSMAVGFYLASKNGFCILLEINYALTLEFLHMLWYNNMQKWRANYEKV